MYINFILPSFSAIKLQKPSYESTRTFQPIRGCFSSTQSYIMPQTTNKSSLLFLDKTDLLNIFGLKLKTNYFKSFIKTTPQQSTKPVEQSPTVKSIEEEMGIIKGVHVFNADGTYTYYPSGNTQDKGYIVKDLQY